MAGPMKPNEVRARKTEQIPDAVFDVFNRLIANKWDGHSARILQDEASKAVAEALNISVGEVFDLRLLDVEESYRAAGWVVEYDKPGYNEMYVAFFIFSHVAVR